MGRSVVALVLNATYEPLCVVPVRRAVVLVLTSKAVPVENGEGALHSATRTGPPVLMFAMSTGTTVKSANMSGAPTVTMTNMRLRTRWTYSRLTTAQNFLMRHRPFR